MIKAFVLAVVLLQAWLSCAQFVLPISDTNFTTLHSPANSNVTLRFKTPPVGTCTTVFPTQKQYAGYVTIPPFTLAPIQQNYTINTFFWFIEARTNTSTSPLTVYINGGPGSSSMVGLFQEAGPCEVVEMAQGRLGTRPRDWGWDRSSNILFVDEPNEVGFSYDEATNGSMNLFTGDITEPPSPLNPPLTADTFLNGTFSSNNASSTANTTQIAAQSVWHMLQAFLVAFPQYNPGTTSNNSKPGVVGVNLFAESYGGKYGPAFANLCERQNQSRKNGSISSNKTLEVRLTSLGIVQGCVDDLVQGRYYPIFANNNTYGIQALSITDQQTAANSFLNANGCQQQVQSCRDAVASLDPNNDGDVGSVNTICQNAQQSCTNTVIAPFMASGRDPYDITQTMPDPFPPSTYLEYLNSGDVQAAIGAPVNYTQSNEAVAAAFQKTGDAERGDQIAQMAYLLSLGVRVALIYGDQDYLCNWLGGQAVSFAVAAQSPAYAPFYGAGYADIVVNQTYVGGAVRQYGNLSFSRIYNAGHLIPAYQPETAFTVFTRIIMGNDISLGGVVDLTTYTSNGTANATFTSKAPDQLQPTCWVRDIQSKCSNNQKNQLKDGNGVIINGVLYDNAEEWKPPPSSVSMAAGFPGVGPSSTVPTVAPPEPTAGSATAETQIPTGVFTATSTPSPSKTSVAQRQSAGAWSVASVGLLALVLGVWAV